MVGTLDKLIAITEEYERTKAKVKAVRVIKQICAERGITDESSQIICNCVRIAIDSKRSL